jgi:hypothetical protein
MNPEGSEERMRATRRHETFLGHIRGHSCRELRVYCASTTCVKMGRRHSTPFGFPTPRTA